MRPTRARGVGALLLSVLAAAPALGAPQFADAQDAAGIAWVHASSAAPNYLETTGSGACWGDVDGDGVDDLVLANGKYNDSTLQAAHDPRTALYLNEGDGTFTDASGAWGADVSGWVQGCALADPDGDGDLDLLLVGYDLLLLLRNEGDHFADRTSEADLTLAGKCGARRCFGTSGAFADPDRDGDLDLYVTNYVAWDLDEGGIISPTLYDGQPNLLWRNRGDGTFEDATAEAGVGDDPGPHRSKSFQSAWADHDRDGWLDLYVASDTTPNTLFRNNRDGTFTDVAAEALVADIGTSMGLAFADATGDGRPDLYFTHWAFEHNGFYENLANGTFLRRSGEAGLASDWERVGWGTGFHDLDHDGDADVYAVNGHTEHMFPDHAQKPQVWLQRPDGTFEDASNASGPSFQQASVARGSAAADYDLDGDLDLAVVASFNETARLLRNGGAPGHWLQVELRQGGMNRFAIGAEVEVRPPGGTAVVRTVQAGNSYLGHDSTIVHAGLGASAVADVVVRWPDGATEAWTGVAADERIRLTRGDPVPLRDTLAPRSRVEVQGPAGARGWFTGDALAIAASEDRAMGPRSGVASTATRLGDGPWTPAGAVALAGEGQHVLVVRSVDHAGNAEPARVRVVGIDATPPGVEARIGGVLGEDGWVAREALVLLEAHDALSGVHEVRHRIDDGPWMVGDRLRFAGSGVHRVEHEAEDVAGHVGGRGAVVVRVDADAPEAGMAAPVVVGLGEAVVVVHASDAGSGVRRVAFRLGDDPTVVAEDTTPHDGWSWTLRTPGVHRVRAQAVDAVGLGAWTEGFVVVLPRPG
jgi:enediyne biosynthesis protein E4